MSYATLTKSFNKVASTLKSGYEKTKAGVMTAKDLANRAFTPSAFDTNWSKQEMLQNSSAASLMMSRQLGKAGATGGASQYLSSANKQAAMAAGMNTGSRMASPLELKRMQKMASAGTSLNATGTKKMIA